MKFINAQGHSAAKGGFPLDDFFDHRHKNRLKALQRHMRNRKQNCQELNQQLKWFLLSSSA